MSPWVKAGFQAVITVVIVYAVIRVVEGHWPTDGQAAWLMAFNALWMAHERR